MHALLGVQRQLIISPACSTVRSVVSSVGVFLQAPMGTRRFALATITGRLRVEAPNALKLVCPYFQVSRRDLSNVVSPTDK